MTKYIRDVSGEIWVIYVNGWLVDPVFSDVEYGGDWLDFGTGPYYVTLIIFATLPHQVSRSITMNILGREGRKSCKSWQSDLGMYSDRKEKTEEISQTRGQLHILLPFRGTNQRNSWSTQMEDFLA
jgi:hypothetical protein